MTSSLVGSVLCIRDRREIRRGLSGGETLVLEPPPELTDGMRVRTGGDTPRKETG
ncbi:MAG: hypothetical protein IRZ00_11880 [Gemmatimonadetes bacterium]|nr:hypothetical protein [Gemmatimonadota bacterium]